MIHHRSTVAHRIFAILTVIALMAFGNTGRASAATVLRVKYNATGTGTGASWANAFTTLEAALTAAGNGDQIWVAKGTYKPGTTRYATFSMKTGVAIYGGFLGGESQLNQRNYKANVTILSGDIGNAGDLSDNAYHVVAALGVLNTGILDGFTITAGNANGLYDTYLGGGLVIGNSSATFQNLIFSGNYAGSGGGAYVATPGTPTFTDITLKNNTAVQYGAGMYTNANAGLSRLQFTTNHALQGGGLYIAGGNATLADVTFTGNTSDQGGGMYVTGSSPQLQRVTFTGNAATQLGGAMYNDVSTAALTDVVFTGNFVVGPSGASGGAMYNGGGAPVLTNVTFTGNYVDGPDTYHDGAAMLNSGSSPQMYNVTFSGNIAKGVGGSGGAMYNYNGSNPFLYNVTISGNVAAHGGGSMYNYLNSIPIVWDSILWNNGIEVVNDGASGGDIANSILAGACPSGTSCANNIDADPRLGLLQNNGGFTQTMAPGAGSAAIDAGDDGTCEPIDQRGVVRSGMGAHCDIGAYEVRTLKFMSTSTKDGQVLESGKNTNKGGAVNVRSSIILVGDSSKNRRYRGFLSFNTGPLPGNAKVVRADLELLQQSASGDPFATQGTLLADVARPYFGLEAKLVTTDWQAKPSAGSVANFGNTLLTNGSWYSASLTGPGLAKVNKNGTTQFKLRFTLKSFNGIGETIGFASGNDPITANRPMLIVYYNP